MLQMWVSSLVLILAAICRTGEPTSLNVCEHATQNIACPDGTFITIVEANYGRTDGTTCPLDGHMSNTECTATNSIDIVRERCDNLQSCDVSASNGVFGDPCPNTYKYLAITYVCLTGPPTSLKVCEHATQNIACPAGTLISIWEANYGRTDGTTCPLDGRMSNTECASKNSIDIVRDRCNNLQSCDVFASNGVFGDPCPYTYKYLAITYVCQTV